MLLAEPNGIGWLKELPVQKHTALLHVACKGLSHQLSGMIWSMQGMPTEDNTGSGSSGTPPTTVGMGGASAASSAPSTPPTRATGGGAGSFPGLGGAPPPF